MSDIIDDELINNPPSGDDLENLPNDDDDDILDIEDDIPEGDDSEEIFDYLTHIKLLLRIVDESQDLILNYYINKVKQSILNYCNRTDFPEELNYVLGDMVIDIYNQNNDSNSNLDNGVGGKVASISEDGRTVEFGSSVSLNQITLNDMLKLRKNELNNFRRVFRHDWF